MPSKSSVLALGLLGLTASLAIGCAPRKSLNANGPSAPPIKKGTKTTPQIASQNDQILLAFNELAWARQTAAFSVFPVSVSTQEGCVVRRPRGSGYFLEEDYSCERASDESDAAADQRHTLNGRLLYSLNSGVYQVAGSFSSAIWQDKTLVARGDSIRHTQISIPSGAVGTTQVSDAELKSSVFKMTANTTYKGQAPEGRVAEQWSSNVTGGFIASASKPLTLLTGSQVSVSYLPETEAGTKRGTQTVQITALSDITYVENGNCLRPVGTFTLSDGSTEVGTLTATRDGYVLSTEATSLHVWGKRCLER